MPTPETEAHESESVGAAAKRVSEHASAIVRLELELAALELKRKIVALGLGIGLAIGAAIFLRFMVGFAYATAAAALATVLPTWAALLIVTGILLFKAALLGILALGRIRKGTPPVPEQAIREAKLTTEALKSDGSGR
jgi:Putative Actinobacterial Holin-X, holin superfamily III